MDGIQQALGVLLVLGLLAGTLWWLRNRGLAQFAGTPRRRKSGRMECIERLPLSPTHSLHFVRIGDRAVVLATSPSGCQVVESVTWSQFESRTPGEPS